MPTRRNLVPDTLGTASREEMRVELGGLQNGHSRMALAVFARVRQREPAAIG